MAIVPEQVKANAQTVAAEIDWFVRVMEARLSLYFGQAHEVNEVYDYPPPDISADTSEYAALVRECGMDFAERIVLILALIPHVRPQVLDTLLVTNKNTGQGFTEFGGIKGKVHMGFLPTGETACFIVHGNDLAARFGFYQLFDDEHFFLHQGILQVEHQAAGEPQLSGVLKISSEYLNRLTTGQYLKPDYSSHFPAKRIVSRLSWDDLVLSYDILDEVENINAWLCHSQTILQDWGLARSVKPGFRCLFYGPPGTGKTLTATLIGAKAGVDVYRIDLSMVVSKYIGETEKNLAGIFDQAKSKNWILFFDEADALFGKRTQTSSSNDRHANQEVSYLLQRIEDFPGVVILATNLKTNIDEAFARRFQTSIYFSLPDADQRLQLWQGYFNQGNCKLEPQADLAQLAECYELSGGAIANVVRYAAIRALRMQRDSIAYDDLLKGINKELAKEGKTI